jgi:protease II
MGRFPFSGFLVVSTLLAGVAFADTLGFEQDPIGAPPAGFALARTGGGADGRWVVRVEKGADKNHVLVQESADTTDYRFPVAIVKEGTYKDVTLRVRARPLSGTVDEAFGLVWRYQDVNNYYVTRCNANEDNCTIYHTVNGSRRSFQNQRVKVAKNTWHTLEVEARGDHFVVSYDGQKVLDATDDTFKDAGRVGLWTKADSVTEFDDLEILPR